MMGFHGIVYIYNIQWGTQLVHYPIDVEAIEKSYGLRFGKKELEMVFTWPFKELLSGFRGICSSRSTTNPG
jgi:hypothetical protein